MVFVGFADDVVGRREPSESAAFVVEASETPPRLVLPSPKVVVSGQKVHVARYVSEAAEVGEEEVGKDVEHPLLRWKRQQHRHLLPRGAHGYNAEGGQFFLDVTIGSNREKTTQQKKRENGNG